MKQPNNRSGVVSLVAVFVIGLFGIATALTTAVGSLIELEKSENTVASDQAFYTAEANAAEGTMQFIGASSTYHGGSAAFLNSTASSSIEVKRNFPAWPDVTILGNATNRTSLVNRTAEQVVSLFPESEAFKHAMFTVGDISFGGSSEVNGNIYTNGNLDLSGSAVVNGDAYYAGTITGATRVTGITKQVSFNTPAPKISEEPYRAAAMSAGTLFSNASDAENYLKNNTRSGIVFVDAIGPMSIQNTDFTGTLFTKGDLSLKSSGNYQYGVIIQPVLIVRGNLDISGGTTIGGLAFVMGETKFTGNNVVNGAIISEGGINVPSGDTTLTFNPAIAANWDDILGLIKDTSAPTFHSLSWGEQ